MSDPLYGKALLRLAAEATGAGRLTDFDAEGSAYNPACGDRISVTIRIANPDILRRSRKRRTPAF